MLSEPPGADPHAGWCGRARVILAPTRFCAGGAASNGRPYRNRVACVVPSELEV